MKQFEESRGAWFPNAHHTRALIGFIQWSQGGVVLDAALQDISNAFGAECAAISRTWANKSNSRISARTDHTDRAAGQQLSRSFALDALGPLVRSLKFGATITLDHQSGDLAEPSSKLEAWLTRRNIEDICFVCLDNRGGVIDFLEIHFARGTARNLVPGVEAIAPELSRIFRERRSGLITEALSRQSVVSFARPSVDQPLLSPDNPAGLTRAEWRVCVLVSRGLSVKAIAEELGVGAATVRTHLKRIYSKTSLDNFHMLARRLVSVDEREALHGRPLQARA